MLSGIKALLVSLPIAAQVATAGVSAAVVSGAGALIQTNNCSHQAVVTSEYTETSDIAAPIELHANGTLLVGEEKVTTPGQTGTLKVVHTVTKHCGKFISDTKRMPTTALQPATEVKQIGNGRIITEDKAVPFEIQNNADATKDKGTSGVTNEGSAGTKRISYLVGQSEGQAQTKIFVKEEVAVQPTARITWYGAKPVLPPVQECPNGTYVNVSGNVVCRPYSGGSQPAGATAQCVDGSWSFSQHTTGTCSYHGGVARWL